MKQLSGDSEKLLNELRDLRARLRDEVRERYHRSLPLNEELSDRWERARYFGLW